MRRAYSYKRFSSPKQARGDSLRRQTEFEQQIVKEMDLLLDDSLDMTDRGVSGFRGDNAKFGALAGFLKMVEDGRVPHGSVLIVENLDRLSRENVLDAFTLFNRIISAGITLVTATPRETYNRETVASDVSKLMVPLVYMMRAHDESVQKSSRLHAAWGRRRQRALEEGRPLTGRCPAWLRATATGYEVIEENAATIRLIYQWVNEGLGLHRITQRLVQEGRPSFGRSGNWTETYVRKLLTWPAVHGELQPHLLVDGVPTPHGAPVPDYYPVIISQEDFQLAQATMTGRRRAMGRPAKDGRDENLFTGMVYLAVDGSKMCLINAGNNAKRPYVYLGSNDVRRGKQTGGRGRAVAYPLFEKLVLDAIEGLRAPDNPGQSEEETAMEKELREVSGELAFFNHRYDEFNDELLNPKSKIATADLIDSLARLAGKIQDLEARRAALAAQVDALRAEPHLVGGSLIQVLDRLKPGPERARVRGVVKTRLHWLVSEIWIYVEPHGRHHAVLHAQVFLRNGQTTYQFGSTAPEKVRPAQLFHAVDLRTHFGGQAAGL